MRTRTVLRKAPVKAINFEWVRWAPFLPQLNRIYDIRYLQHFSVIPEYPRHVPKGRMFYEQPWKIDAGALMYERYVHNDSQVRTLIDLGWRVEKSRVLPPNSFCEFMEGMYRRLHRKGKEQGKEWDDLPIPAIQFSLKNKTGNCMQDNLFVRVGLDEIPDPGKWELMLSDDNGVIDVPIDLFEKVFCGNRPPMNVVMFDHDITHVANYLNNETYYQVNQEVFARFCGRHPTKPKLNYSDDPTSGNAYTMYGRMCALHEELCLPDISRSRKIEMLLDTLERLRNPIHQAGLLVEVLPWFVVRYGGGMGDPYNLNNDLLIRSTPAQRLGMYTSDGSKHYFKNTGRELFSQLAIESMLGLASDLSLLSESYDMYPNGKDMLEDKLFRLIQALRVGIELQITVEKFSRETMDQFVDPNCDSIRWLQSFQQDNSLTSVFYTKSAFR